jgi:MFS transporter, DHA1 family, multidrug resistance protein
MAGFALSQVFYGPFADRFGRRPVILVAIATFLIGSLVCALSTDLQLMILASYLPMTRPLGKVLAGQL